MLLTGHAELAAAVAAVNDGCVFRFLTKPCPPQQLLGVTKDTLLTRRALPVRERARARARARNTGTPGAIGDTKGQLLVPDALTLAHPSSTTGR